jgi:hypothetical protein
MRPNKKSKRGLFRAQPAHSAARHEGAIRRREGAIGGGAGADIAFYIGSGTRLRGRRRLLARLVLYDRRRRIGCSRDRRRGDRGRHHALGANLARTEARIKRAIGFAERTISGGTGGDVAQCLRRRWPDRRRDCHWRRRTWRNGAWRCDFWRSRICCNRTLHGRLRRDHRRGRRRWRRQGHDLDRRHRRQSRRLPIQPEHGAANDDECQRAVEENRYFHCALM